MKTCGIDTKKGCQKRQPLILILNLSLNYQITFKTILFLYVNP